ncbi:hypothetical protein [Pediococcus ethanolidurans]|uniref:Uncharacterized protein n=1 Tax=Pediococcus ethanolidurans TaxID=319653 RepID=A0A0R2K0M6_9LACO|nr:hypothetical protein [Pediococcus ethanolidurans]KRN83121.1 hypothetical protein IV87_GL001559 [Pediococcus ethanolidurans]MBU7555905.1 hypothetical protein [Pediococcus ethanolidurans]MBU7564421.1 hypothetical protein [Pediococcus ethanolidurans]MCT4399027.1 hypothetical protein [Pediococcus ethanolidurans]MCV3316401.1 hypothetical protein [Pediococcus ethanolidurans]
MKPQKIILLGIIGAFIIGTLALITTIIKVKFGSAQTLVDIVGIIMFTGFGLYVAKLRDKAKK